MADVPNSSGNANSPAKAEKTPRAVSGLKFVWAERFAGLGRAWFRRYTCAP